MFSHDCVFFLLLLPSVGNLFVWVIKCTNLHFWTKAWWYILLVLRTTVTINCRLYYTHVSPALKKQLCKGSVYMLLSMYWYSCIWNLHCRHQLLPQISQLLSSVEGIPDIWRQTGRPCIPRLVCSLKQVGKITILCFSNMYVMSTIGAVLWGDLD